MKNVKSIIAVLLIAAMCLSLFAGCGKDNEEKPMGTEELILEFTEVPTLPETEPPTIPEPEPTIEETEPAVVETEPVATEPAVDDRYDNIAGDKARYTEVEQTVYAVNDVNIRTGPGVDYSKIGMLKYGSTVTRIAYSNHGWSKVIYEGQIVYISSEYLSLKDPSAPVNPYTPKEDKNDTEEIETEKDESQTGGGNESTAGGNSGNSSDTGNTGNTNSTGNTGGNGSAGENTGTGSANGNTSGGSGTTTTPESGSSHVHSYSSSVFDPTCKNKGYTTYRCSCGDSYVANETSPTGVCVYNSWCVTVPATYDAEGTEARTCCMCGGQETRSIPKLEREEADSTGESISTGDLAAHGNAYASSLGFIVDTSMNSGNAAYYPPLDYDIDTMSGGYAVVEGSVKETFDRLSATGESPEGVCRVNVEVSYGYDHPSRGDIYYVTVYYG